tara:strand:- start:5612 stop:6778 length:1167 start_codon:yes stop_codon:yes gene_type:complete
MSRNRFASTVVTSLEWQAALEQQCHDLASSFASGVDLLVVFVSPHFQPELEEIVGVLTAVLSPRHMIGSTGESIVADAVEIEGTPAISVWCASLPDTQVDSMRLTFERTPDGGTFIGWPESLSGKWSEDAVMLLVGEPFSFPADGLLTRLEEDRPGLPVVGGMASGFHSPNENRIIVGEDVFNNGAAVIILQHGVKTHTIVSQGCRPIGDRFVITQVEQNTLLGLGGKPALDVLKGLYEELPNHEQAAMQGGFHIGRVVSEYQDEYQMGDFLIRNVLGVDPDQKAVVVADFLRVGQTIQFHIRDNESASLELNQLVSQIEEPTAAALLFTCNGRGTRLFDVASHDAAAVSNHLGSIPIAGFFAQGELGPVGGKNFLHGFTASSIVFES